MWEDEAFPEKSEQHRVWEMNLRPEILPAVDQAHDRKRTSEDLMSHLCVARTSRHALPLTVHQTLRPRQAFDSVVAPTESWQTVRAAHSGFCACS